MEQNLFTKTDIQKLFKIKVDPRTLLNAEQRGGIPLSRRYKHGKTEVRKWTKDQLPIIGKKYGFLKNPKDKIILAIYTHSNGGCGKSTLAFNLSRMLAFHGIKSLVIGLDFQGTITQLCMDQSKTNDYKIEDKTQKSIANLINENTPIEELIKKTDLEYLDYIPENLNLAYSQLSIEEIKNILIKHLKQPTTNYDVILFDCPPPASNITIGALSISDYIISPFTNNQTSEQANNYHLVENELYKAIGIKKDRIKIIKSSHYLNNEPVLPSNKLKFQNNLLNNHILKNPKISPVANQNSSFELIPKNEVSLSYSSVIHELWDYIINNEVLTRYK